MPNNANARKAMRQNEKRRLRNRAARSTLKTILKKARAEAAAGNNEGAQTAFRTAVKSLDQAASKNLIHKNKASRLKSRLSQYMKKITTGQAPAAKPAAE